MVEITSEPCMMATRLRNATGRRGRHEARPPHSRDTKHALGTGIVACKCSLGLTVAASDARRVSHIRKFQLGVGGWVLLRA